MRKQVLLFLQFLLAVFAGSSPRIQTIHGVIEGKTVTLTNGKNVDAFLGIPFADKPTGKYRFAPPQPLTPWNDTLAVKSYSKACYQAATDEMRKFCWFVSKNEESEDCLYLNVWRPSERPIDEKLAVMIWISPGGFSLSSSDLPTYNGEILAAEHNVLVCSMNFRQSMFGYLFLNSTDVPGNVALQDQIQAIEWIKNNVKAFGGDPDRITIFGQSSGAMSVGYLLTNPKTYGLFQRAIMQSGPTNSVFASMTQGKALDNAATLAKRVNCQNDDVVEMVNCLRERTPSEILADYRPLPLYLAFPFQPVRNGIEVPMSPFTAFRDISEDRRKDLLIGNIPGEVSYFVTSFFPGQAFNDDFNVSESDIRNILKNLFGLGNEVLQNIILFTYKSFRDPDAVDLRREAVDILTDPTFVCPSIDFAKSWTGLYNNVYYYNFHRRPAGSADPLWAEGTHGDEIQFVFGNPLNSKHGFSKQDQIMSAVIMTYWTNFAKTGNPNGVQSSLAEWPNVQPNSNFTYLDFGENITKKTFLKEKKCALWEDMYPQLIQLQGKV